MNASSKRLCGSCGIWPRTLMTCSPAGSRIVSCTIAFPVKSERLTNATSGECDRRELADPDHREGADDAPLPGDGLLECVVAEEQGVHLRKLAGHGGKG